MVTATYLWSDSTIVLHQIADNEKIKDIWVENRLQEILLVRDKFNVQFRHVPTADNPADIVSRGIAASELQNCSKWWFGPQFLSFEAAFWPNGPSSLTERTHSVPSPSADLDTYGSSSFAALYVETFTPEERIPKRKLRSRKKPNPLDTIAEPLPTTSVSAYSIAALGHTSHSDEHPPTLPPATILSAETEQKFPQWSRQVRITYYVLRFAAAYLRRLRERLLAKRIGQRKKVSFMPVFTPALGFDLADRFNSSRPNLRDLSITELIMLRKTQLGHPPSSTDRRNLGIFKHNGLLYVKGRLGNMKMRPSALTPLYLPKDAKETALVIMDYHRINCHSGVQATLANIRMRYWFTSGRRTVQRAIYQNCFPCRREALHPYATPPWPQLPSTRVTHARPFFCTGLDFFGPCLIRVPHHNGGYEIKKYYVAIFVCMTYRCVHLELCSDLSTEQFLHALRRFGSRREFPARILSDNGQSFLTARQVIDQIRRSSAPTQAVKRRNPIRQVVSARLSKRGRTTHSVEVPNANNPPPPTLPTLTPEEEALIDYCQKHKIEWQTITELSPWRGGVYERLIGLIEHCLRRSIGRSKPTEVEFSSLLAEAERTANSRPLSYIADSDTDFYLVRPLDILHPLLRDEAPQNPLDPPVEEDCDPNDADFVAPGENRLYAKLIQSLKKSRRAADTFWTEFRDGYLAELRGRGIDRKNNQFGEPTIQLGDLVLIKEPDVPRCDWRLALVTDLLPDQDGLIRTARVRFSRTHQEHTRALEHLYPIGNVPRVPTRCDTTACADVYSLSFISESTDAMASNSTSATTTDTDPVGQDSTSDELTTAQSSASLTTHSVGGEVQTPEQSTTPSTTNSSTAANAAALKDRADAMYKVIFASLQAAETATSEAEQLAIIEDMRQKTKALLVAGPRADPTPTDQDQEATTEDNTTPEQSETTHSVEQLEDAQSETTPPPTTTSNEQTTTEPIIDGSTPPSDPAPQSEDQSETTGQSETSTAEEAPAAPNTQKVQRGAPPTRIFRGAFRLHPMHINATPRPPYQRPEETSEKEPAKAPPEAETPAPTTHSVDSPEPSTKPGPQAESAPSVEAPQVVETPDADETPDETAHSADLPEAPAAPTTTPPAARIHDADLVPAQPVFDHGTLPEFPTLDEVKRRLRQLYVTDLRQGQMVQEIDHRMLAGPPRAEPQQIGFGFDAHFHRSVYGRPTGHIWDPSTVCDGHGENRRRFHQSLLVFKIINKKDWLSYPVIAASTELQQLLEHVLTLHVRCLGHMILLVYAVRLRGNHGRVKSILLFIRDMLKTTDFDWKIPQLINRYYTGMTQGLAAHISPRPAKEDFRRAAENWLCYCHAAFVSFIEHLSGKPVWSTGEWLQSKELDNKFREAIRVEIVTKAPWVLQDLRDRAYRQYVLLYIRAIENDDLPPLDSTCGKIILFVDNDFWFSPLAKGLNENVQLIRIDSDNRAIVLGMIRSYLPGPETTDAIFWFGRQYFVNGNEDYGNLIADICFHYTTFFGRVRQYVVLPPYNRIHRQVWAGQALCLYMQKDIIVPHAQVVLHPYDENLWADDQEYLDQGKDLPPWKNTKQDADGAYYKYGALEARKYNLKKCHGIDLWKWYQGDHPGERPPAETEDFYQRKATSRTTIALITPHSGDGDSWTTAPAPPPPVPVQPIVPAAVPQPIVPAAAPVRPVVPPPAPVTVGPSQVNPPINIVNIFGESALAEVIQLTAQQYYGRISDTLDARLGRIEELLHQLQEEQRRNATAEDRH